MQKIIERNGVTVYATQDAINLWEVGKDVPTRPRGYVLECIGLHLIERHLAGYKPPKGVTIQDARMPAPVGNEIGIPKLDRGGDARTGSLGLGSAKPAEPLPVVDSAAPVCLVTPDRNVLVYRHGGEAKHGTAYLNRLMYGCEHAMAYNESNDRKRIPPHEAAPILRELGHPEVAAEMATVGARVWEWLSGDKKGDINVWLREMGDEDPTRFLRDSVWRTFGCGLVAIRGGSGAVEITNTPEAAPILASLRAHLAKEWGK